MSRQDWIDFGFSFGLLRLFVDSVRGSSPILKAARAYPSSSSMPSMVI
ncbi:unnamed protein product [Arabidopsis lyrata]|nr:unnamed protein product [Arabidopsis lyrata]